MYFEHEGGEDMAEARGERSLLHGVEGEGGVVRLGERIRSFGYSGNEEDEADDNDGLEEGDGEEEYSRRVGDDDDDDDDDDEQMGTSPQGLGNSAEKGMNKRKAYSSSGYEKELASDFSSAVQSGDIGDSLPAVRSFFIGQLHEYLKSLNSNSTLVDMVMKDWCVVLQNRSGVLSMNMFDILYINNKENKKMKSRVEVALAVNFIPALRPSKEIPKEYLYDCAKENRQRLLVSQALIGKQFTYKGGSDECIRIEHDSNQDDIVYHFKDQTKERSHFAFGNTTVLDWGRVVDWPHFHTDQQLYPIGFKCIRQEHDIILDRVVDCLCEIDCIYLNSDSPSDTNGLRGPGRKETSDMRDGEERVPSEQEHLSINTTPGTHSTDETNRVDQRVPLFRISVLWDLATSLGKHVVRVYEGRTPQQVWQAVMLEGIGIKRTDVPFDVSSVMSYSAGLNENKLDNEKADNEERELRRILTDLRSKYLQYLRTEQKMGFRRAFQPRLPIENYDNLFDEHFLRIMEGQKGSVSCRYYKYLDSRTKDQNNLKFLKVNYIKYIAAIQIKMKHIERIIRKNLTLRILEEREANEKLRREDAEMKKKQRQESKDTKLQKQALYAQRKMKLRESERQVRTIRDNVIKEIKKNREIAKSRAENLVENEKPKERVSRSVEHESDVPDIAPREPRPSPSDRHVNLAYDGFGKLLELWGLLASMTSILQLEQQFPPVRTLHDALQACDPYLRHVRHKLRNTVSLQNIVEKIECNMTPQDGTTLLNTIGVALCNNLLEEFNKVMYADINEQTLGGCKFEVNSLNWKELGRIILLSHALKCLNTADVDATARLKGRGNTMTPDAFDRGTLKLLKRRISHGYSKNRERHMKLNGFKSGLVVRVPAPGPVNRTPPTWQSFITSLLNVESAAGWLVHQVIKAASESVLISTDKETNSQRISDLLLVAISPAYFDPHDARLTKTIAFHVLKKFGGNKYGNRPVKLFPDANRFPITVFDEWEQLSNSSISTARPFSYPDHFGEETEGWGLKGLRSLLSTIDPDQYPEIQYEDRELDKTTDNLFVGDEDKEDKEDERDEDKEEDKMDVIKEDSAPLVSSPQANIDFPSTDTDSEFEDISNLNIAMQRCYAVLKAIMSMDKSLDFIEPVSPQEHPLYYEYIRQPLCLQDVRRCLLSGGYKNSIFRFYKDVTLVFHNAQVYNSDITQISLNSQKMLVIFERLFLEMVLCYNNPLSYHQNCHFCRLSIPQNVTTIICERCEAPFHLECVQKRAAPNKVDWFCDLCIEERGVEHVHPYRNAQVKHKKHGRYGQVIGIEQFKGNLRFLVSFEGKNEHWSGMEVRDGWPSSEIVGGNCTTFGTSQMATLPGLPFMPSGYFFDDYDMTCGVAAGYGGWGSRSCFYPNDMYSQIGFQLRLEDPQFEDILSALGALGIADSVDDFGYREWITLLNSLAHRVLKENTDLVKMSDLSESFNPESFAELLDPARLVVTKNIDDNDLEEGHKTKSDEDEKDEENEGNDDNNDDDVGYDDVRNGDEFDTSMEASTADASNSSLFSDDKLKPEEKLERRRLSRIKGREDAMFSSVLMKAVLKEIDLSDDEDEAEKLERGESADSPSALVQMIIKTCAPKPTGSSLYDSHWISSMNKKLTSLNEEDALPPQQVAVCHYCGFSERALASCFIKMETRLEWEKRMKESNQSAPTKISTNFLLPYDHEDAAIEEEDYGSLRTTHRFIEGSSIAHECCVDTIVATRALLEDKQEKINKINQERSARIDEIKASELLNLLSRVRNLQIGCDRNGRSYWILYGSPALYVSMPHTSVCADLSQGHFKIPSGQEMSFSRVLTSSNAVDILSTRSIVNCEKHDLCGYGSVGYFTKSLWDVYEDPRDIARMVNWFDVNNSSERIMKLVLTRLFPNAASVQSFNVPIVPNIDIGDRDLLAKAENEYNSTSESLFSMLPSKEASILGKRRTRDDDTEENLVSSPRTSELAVISSDIGNKEESSVDRREGSSRPDFKSLVAGTKVNVGSGVWCGKILESKIDSEARLYYKVRFDGWGKQYDSWHPEFEVSQSMPKSDEDTDNLHSDSLDVSGWETIEFVKSLNAINYLFQPDRARGVSMAPLVCSAFKTDLEILKLSLLTVLAALPLGALDEKSEDKWGSNFTEAWKEAVLLSSGASELMSCQLILEYGIKVAWLKQAGQRLLSTLPSKTHSMKYASTGLISLRLSALDKAIRYSLIGDSSENNKSSEKESNKKSRGGGKRR